MHHTISFFPLCQVKEEKHALISDVALPWRRISIRDILELKGSWISLFSSCELIWKNPCCSYVKQKQVDDTKQTQATPKKKSYNFFLFYFKIIKIRGQKHI